MMPDTILVLSTDSVEKLRIFLPSHPSALIDFDDDIRHDLNLKFVPAEYQIVEKKAVLDTPISRDQEGLKDTENCKRIIEILPKLSAADATDERLWVTLSVFNFREYALARWPIVEKSSDERSQFIKNHWFASGVRGRMRDNAISRLWWMGHIASRIPGQDMDDVFEILFYNSDYRSSLLERTSSANAVNVTSGILEITKRAYGAGVQYDREKFRSFMKEIDFLGGRINLVSLGTEEIVELLTPIYNKSYSID
jgi:hypothetical protein